MSNSLLLLYIGIGTFLFFAIWVKQLGGSGRFDIALGELIFLYSIGFGFRGIMRALGD